MDKSVTEPQQQLPEAEKLIAAGRPSDSPAAPLDSLQIAPDSAPPAKPESPQPQGVATTLHFAGIALGTIVALSVLLAAILWLWQDNLGTIDAEGRSALLAPDNVLVFEQKFRPATPDSPRIIEGREIGPALSRRIAELVISDESTPPESLSTLDPSSSLTATIYTVQYRLLDGTVIDVEYSQANNSIFVLRRRSAEAHREVLTRKSPGRDLVHLFALLFPQTQREEPESIQL